MNGGDDERAPVTSRSSRPSRSASAQESDPKVATGSVLGTSSKVNGCDRVECGAVADKTARINTGATSRSPAVARLGRVDGMIREMDAKCLDQAYETTQRRDEDQYGNSFLHRAHNRDFP